METITATPAAGIKTSKGAGSRFLSLDVFRGMTIAGMILVNTPGSWEYVYAPLRHSKWNGCTPTDLVFPFFLFAVGNAMAFSMSKFQGLDNGKVIQKIFTRAALIFFIGLFLNWFPFIRWQDNEYVGRAFESLRIYGVLQRIALAYLGGALIVHFLKPMQAFFAALGLLVAYWIILLSFGDLTLEGNAVLKLDRWLLNESHLYHGYFSDVRQENIAFDPEGLLSAIPAIASVIFGFLAGRFIKERGNSYETIAHLVVAGVLLIFAAQCWDLIFPINKPIWSSSYVFYTTGLAMTILSVILFFVEMKGVQGWTRPFVIFGKNPLFIYVLAGVWGRMYGLIRIGDSGASSALYENVFRPIGGDINGSLMFAISHVLLFLLIGWIMDRNKIYVRV
jgi:predicted acyltransferase